MNDILKMIHFDYCISEKQMRGGLLLICTAALCAMLMNPVLGCLMIPFAAILFLFGHESTVSADFRRCYGILPVQRSSITRAGFMEYFASALAGELLSLLMFRLSVLLKLYLRIRTFFAKHSGSVVSDSLTGSKDVLQKYFSLFLGIFMAVCLFMCIFRMLSSILGSENDIKIMLGMLLIIAAIVVPLLTMLVSGKMRVPELTWLHPAGIGGRLLLFLAVNLLTAGVCALLCEITVKVLNQREF